MKITKKKRELAKLEKQIQNYKEKISKVTTQNENGELSDKRRDYFLRTYDQKIKEYERKYNQCRTLVEHSTQCIQMGIINDDPDNIVAFKRGPLTHFIKNNMWFWRSIFPDSKEFVKIINEEYYSKPFLVNCENKKLASLLGTATDLFSGLLVGYPLANQLMSYSSSGDLGLLKEYIFCIFFRLNNEILSNCRPSTWTHCELIASSIVCLARMDSSYRAFNVEYNPDLRDLKKLNPMSSTLDDLEKEMKNLSSGEINTELLLLADSLFESLPKYRIAKYNPYFKGYFPILDSDGDLILDSTLYELKCISQNRKILDWHMFQLAGYFLLSKLSGYSTEIEYVGLINPRNKFIFTQSIDEFFNNLGAISVKNALEKFTFAFSIYENLNRRINPLANQRY